jgi:hypothetical protein
MTDRDLTALRAEAMAEAIWEAECDRDFMRQCVALWVNSLAAEELNDYLNPDRHES